MKDLKGFTLVEILIVISIISTLLMIPLFKGTALIGLKERRELREFKNDIEYARNKAIVEAKIYVVKIDFKSNSYTISNYSNKGAKTIKKKELSNGIKLISSNIWQNEIRFGYSGAPSYSGTIFLENRKGERIVMTVLPATGKVNIEVFSK